MYFSLLNSQYASFILTPTNTCNLWIENPDTSPDSPKWGTRMKNLYKLARDGESPVSTPTSLSPLPKHIEKVPQCSWIHVPFSQSSLTSHRRDHTLIFRLLSHTLSSPSHALSLHSHTLSSKDNDKNILVPTKITITREENRCASSNNISQSRGK